MIGRLNALLIVAATLALTACESMQPATYSNLADNTLTLRNFGGAKVYVASMVDKSNFDAGCRLVGPIQTSGGRTIAQFIQDSLNDELKFAGLYSIDTNAVRLTATLQKAAFSSQSGLTEGWWDFSLELANSANGRAVIANNKYDFHSGFAAAVACANSSQALTPAVQKLIYTAFADPAFPALIGISSIKAGAQ